MRSQSVDCQSTPNDGDEATEGKKQSSNNL
jgi:hypothetical protein